MTKNSIIALNIFTSKKNEILTRALLANLDLSFRKYF